MPRPNFYVALVLFWSLAVSGALSSSSGQRLQTIEELLESHHVELTKAGLLKALRAPEPEVRWLAAQKLAADKVRDAAPAIAEALDKDWRLPQNRVNIASALAALGEPKGLEALEASCGDPGIDPSLRLTAARYMLDLGNEACLKDVLGTLENEKEALPRMEALSLLPRFEHIAADDRRKSLRLITKSLKDETPAVRMSAATTLVSLGETNAVEEIQSAVESEKDEAVRNHLRIELRKLEKKAKPRH